MYKRVYKPITLNTSVDSKEKENLKGLRPCKRHIKSMPSKLDPMVVLSDFNWHMIMEDTVFPNYNFDPFELIEKIESRNGCSICYFGSEGLLYLKKLLKTY